MGRKRKGGNAAAAGARTGGTQRSRLPRVASRPARHAAARARHRIQRIVRRYPLRVAAALVVLHVVLALITFAPQPHTGGDNAAYITLARSLLEHGTYTELWDPGAPPHTKYPPAFPAILAVAMALGLQPWVQLKLVVLSLSATGVAFSFLWMRAQRRAALALGVGVVLAIAPGVLREGRWILSDVPFWAFTMIALWAFARLRTNDWKRFAIAALATLAAYFTRSAGLPLVLAALAWLAWRRQWKQFAALAIIVGVPAILWWLRARAFGPSGYVSEFWLVDPYVPAMGRIGVVELFQRVGQNASKYVTIHLPILLTGGAGAAIVLVSLATFLIALGSWLRRLRSPGVAELFLPLYIGLIFIWPDVWSGERFLLPVLGLLLFYAGDMVVYLGRRLLPGHAFLTGAVAVALLGVLAFPGLSDAARVGRACTALYRAGDRFPCLGSPAWDDLFAMAEMAGAALPEDAVVISRKPRLFYALGGSRSIIYPFSTDPDAFFAAANAAGARYVVFDRFGTADAYLRPVLLGRPQAFCIMHVAQASGTVLFGIAGDAADIPGPAVTGAADPDSPSFSWCGPEYWRSPEAMRRFGGP